LGPKFYFFTPQKAKGQRFFPKAKLSQFFGPQRANFSNCGPTYVAKVFPHIFFWPNLGLGFPQNLQFSSPNFSSQFGQGNFIFPNQTQVFSKFFPNNFFPQHKVSHSGPNTHIGGTPTSQGSNSFHPQISFRAGHFPHHIPLFPFSLPFNFNSGANSKAIFRPRGIHLNPSQRVLHLPSQQANFPFWPQFSFGGAPTHFVLGGGDTHILSPPPFKQVWDITLLGDFKFPLYFPEVGSSFNGTSFLGEAEPPPLENTTFFPLTVWGSCFPPQVPPFLFPDLSPPLRGVLNGVGAFGGPFGGSKSPPLLGFFGQTYTFTVGTDGGLRAPEEGPLHASQHHSRPPLLGTTRGHFL